ncbi:hypothetical protein AVEN_258823-1 [Araneus ventricosus]|uniref:Uncharacterized protein n=1 Tax=Araneus ventricosus TaxID=182803 RepID=A0A4Y2W7N4_ARAVE|nr:hypothetical protein AVEN_258823-1 [Araneus ventricosus]
MYRRITKEEHISVIREPGWKYVGHTKPCAETTQLWWKRVLSNKLSRINIAKLISFLTENENRIKQPPHATSSSDSDPGFSLSPRPQTYGLRPSRGSIPRTLISPPTSTNAPH